MCTNKELHVQHTDQKFIFKTINIFFMNFYLTKINVRSFILLEMYTVIFIYEDIKIHIF